MTDKLIDKDYSRLGRLPGEEDWEAQIREPDPSEKSQDALWFVVEMTCGQYGQLRFEIGLRPNREPWWIALTGTGWENRELMAWVALRRQWKILKTVQDYLNPPEPPQKWEFPDQLREYRRGCSW